MDPRLLTEGQHGAGEFGRFPHKKTIIAIAAEFHGCLQKHLNAFVVHARKKVLQSLLFIFKNAIMVTNTRTRGILK